MPATDFELFRNLAPGVSAELLRQLPSHTYEPGEILIRENQVNNRVFLIEDGSLAVWKGEPNTPGAVQVATLGAGQCFGEMSALNSAPASATIVAATRTLVREMGLEDVPSQGQLREVVTLNLAQMLVGRLTAATSTLREKHEGEMNAMRVVAQASAFLTRILTALSFYMFSMPLIFIIKPLLPSDSLISFFFILAFLWVVLDVMTRSEIREEYFHLSLRGWPRQVLMGVVWALPFMVLFLYGKMWMVHTATEKMNVFEPMRALTANSDPSPWLWVVFAVAYAVLSFAQEFIRCAVQATLEMIAIPATTTSHWKSILVSDVVFASIHMHLGGSFAFLAFVAGLVFGYQFWRAKSYLTVAVSHALFGVWAIFIIGIPH